MITLVNDTLNRLVEKASRYLNILISRSVDQSMPGFEPGPHWWEVSALTTASPLLPELVHY